MKEATIRCENPDHSIITGEATGLVTRAYRTKRPKFCGLPSTSGGKDACARDMRRRYVHVEVDGKRTPERVRRPTTVRTVAATDGSPDLTAREIVSSERGARPFLRDTYDPAVTEGVSEDVLRATRAILMEGESGGFVGPSYVENDSLENDPATLDDLVTEGRWSGVRERDDAPQSGGSVQSRYEDTGLDQWSIPRRLRAGHWAGQYAPTPEQWIALIEEDPSLAVHLDRVVQRVGERRVLRTIARRNPALALQMSQVLDLFRSIVPEGDG